MDRRKEMNDNRGILIFKNEFPYKAVATIAEASRVTKVPFMTVKRMIDPRKLNKLEKRNGGRTSPDGWGFDVTCLPGD